ncbi:hypothetical protein Pyn_35633 [Prunus yedoensis var. nudiflora]|uniref:Uncharacterized protein n=1 Tax=Prunus yedoensis var. nudiflora TaxID=2094558 RepID=A0A314YML4_PRUYE|nr:hypothetical protein Pyn_35633 [Prunus yedoensis var. nudiflora]
MNRILRGIKDVQNLSNSLCVQNEILQESHAELADHVNTQQESEPASTPNTNEATSSSTAAEAPGRNEIDARKILKEKKAWRERNKHLERPPEEEESGRLGGNRRRVDGITSKLRELVTRELKSV